MSTRGGSIGAGRRGAHGGPGGDHRGLRGGAGRPRWLRDGCADLDNDEDGVLDEHDKCPDEPEDIDGFEDDDGCHDDPPAVLPADG